MPNFFAVLGGGDSDDDNDAPKSGGNKNVITNKGAKNKKEGGGGSEGNNQKAGPSARTGAGDPNVPAAVDPARAAGVRKQRQYQANNSGRRGGGGRRREGRDRDGESVGRGRGRGRGRGDGRGDGRGKRGDGRGDGRGGSSQSNDDTQKQDVTRNDLPKKPSSLNLKTIANIVNHCYVDESNGGKIVRISDELNELGPKLKKSQVEYPEEILAFCRSILACFETGGVKPTEKEGEIVTAAVDQLKVAIREAKDKRSGEPSKDVSDSGAIASSGSVDIGSKSRPIVSQDELMSGYEFLVYCAQRIDAAIEEDIRRGRKTIKRKQWSKLSISVESQVDGKRLFLSWMGTSGCDEWIKKVVEPNEDAFRSCAAISIMWDPIIDEVEFLPDEFTKESIETYFQPRKLADIKNFQTRTTLPLEPTSSSNVVSLTPGLVRTEPDNAESFFSSNIELDKSYAVVVAGESGSGKSVYACQQASNSSDVVLYCLIEGEDLNNAKTPKPIGEYPLLTNFFRLLLNIYESENSKLNMDPDNCSAFASLYATTGIVNAKRNKWAVEVLSNRIEKNGDDATEPNVADWVKGYWHQEDRPEKVAIVVDEATDIDFAEGLVSMVRQLTLDWTAKLAKKNVLIVVAGTGLDAIRYPGRVGTNPELARLVIMRTPDTGSKLQTALSKAMIRDRHKKAVLATIGRGVYTKIQSTNARTLTCGALPVLCIDFWHSDLESFSEAVLQSRLEDRLTLIGSFSPVMDYAVRQYLTSNTVGKLSGKDRSDLLEQAFVFHLVSAMEAREKNKSGEPKMRSKTVEDNLQRELVRVKNSDAFRKLDGNLHDVDVFSRGLANRSGTSPALKYMSCLGRTLEVRSSFGEGFEEMVSLHYMRYLEIVEGINIFRLHRLLHSWPPKYSGGNKTRDYEDADFFAQMRGNLAETKLDELSGLPDPPKIGEPECFVFKQGGATAQGPDCLALRVPADKSLAYLDAIQCKNYQSLPSTDTFRGWYNSLGVNVEADLSYNLAPTTGSAAYSFIGLDMLRSTLEDWLGDRVTSVKIGRRIIAVSCKMPPLAKMPIPNNDNVSVWFGEMLEPTISIASFVSIGESFS